jgi:cell division protein FtsA
MIKEKFFCGLDIGGSQIKAALVKLRRDSSLEIVGAASVVSSGIDESSVSHLSDLSKSVQDLLSSLMKQAACKIKDVNLGFAGHLISKRTSTVIIPLVDKGNKPITRFDLKKVERQACLLGVDLDEKKLHYFANRYLIDGTNFAINPLGLYGRKLESESLLITTKNIFITNIVKAVNLAGFDVKAVHFSSLLASEVCLSGDNKKKGVLFLNIGAWCSDLIYFKDGFVQEIQMIPWGGGHLTEKISQELKVPFDLAKEIKHSYATVIDYQDSSPQGEILVKRDSKYIPILRQDICRVVMASTDHFIKMVEDNIFMTKLGSLLNEGIVLGGGGALLTGLIERIEKKTHLQARIGKVSIEARRMINPAFYGACIGLALASTMKGSLDNRSFSENHKLHMKILHYVGDLYHEYF